MARKSKTRKAKAISGRMFPYVDVSANDKNKVNKFLDMIKSGRTIIVLVYANWCGHCHTFKPRFDKAANSGNTNVAAAIESEALPAINASLPKPISVEGYPTVIAIGEKGNQMAEMTTPQGSETEIVTQLNNVMKNLNSVKKPTTNVSLTKPSRFNIVENEAVTVRPPNVAPLMEEPETVFEEEVSNTESEKMVGGSLYGALGAAAVQLAPTGILLGIHSLMKKRRGRSVKANKNRKTRKVRKSKI